MFLVPNKACNFFYVLKFEMILKIINYQKKIFMNGDDNFNLFLVFFLIIKVALLKKLPNF